MNFLRYLDTFVLQETCMIFGGLEGAKVGTLLSHQPSQEAFSEQSSWAKCHYGKFSLQVCLSLVMTHWGQGLCLSHLHVLRDQHSTGGIGGNQHVCIVLTVAALCWLLLISSLARRNTKAPSQQAFWRSPLENETVIKVSLCYTPSRNA